MHFQVLVLTVEPQQLDFFFDAGFLGTPQRFGFERSTRDLQPLLAQFVEAVCRMTLSLTLA